MKFFLMAAFSLSLGAVPALAADQKNDPNAVPNPELTSAPRLEVQLKSQNPTFNFDTLIPLEDKLDGNQTVATINPVDTNQFHIIIGGPGYYDPGYYYPGYGPGYYYPGYGYGGWGGYGGGYYGGRGYRGGHGYGGHGYGGHGYGGHGRRLMTAETFTADNAVTEDSTPVAVSGVACLSGPSLERATVSHGVLPSRVQERAVRSCTAGAGNCQALGCFLY